jgi:hypothetical protein
MAGAVFQSAALLIESTEVVPEIEQLCVHK